MRARKSDNMCTGNFTVRKISSSYLCYGEVTGSSVTCRTKAVQLFKIKFTEYKAIPPTHLEATCDNTDWTGLDWTGLDWTDVFFISQTELSLRNFKANSFRTEEIRDQLHDRYVACDRWFSWAIVQWSSTVTVSSSWRCFNAECNTREFWLNMVVELFRIKTNARIS